MAAQQPIADLSITSLRGGMNDSDPPNALADDECVLAQNIEFFSSTLGERRNGCGPITISGSGLTREAGIAHLSQWFPANAVLNPEWFAVGATPAVSTTIAKRTDGIWTEVVPKDAIDIAAADVYSIQTQSLNGKLFWLYRSAQDRAHVWASDDGGVTWRLRRAGLAQPAVPTVANEGGGTYATIRYFRVRFITKNGASILRRSEPSENVAFTPSGTGNGVTISRPAVLNEGETHWEVEASDDNATFYIIATLPIATSTYNDETALPTSYADGTLSEAVGTYSLIPSAKFMVVEGDRLVFGGHFTDPAQQSTVSWAPVKNDPGVGNDERLPTASINNTRSLDNYDGGPLTGMSSGGNGTWYAFKWEAIYKAVRTGDATNAYDIITLSKRNGSTPGRGAIPGSIVAGADESGAACIYSLAPHLGPSRLGTAGLQVIVGLRTTWKRVALQAGIVARGCYYPYKQQVHWWLAVDGGTAPAFKIVLQVSELRAQSVAGGNGIGRGWSLATGRITQATAVSVFTELVSIAGVTSISDRPVIGLSSPDYLQRCDTESTDAGVAFTAVIRTRPYIVTGLLNQWGAMVAALLANANATASVVVKFIRDFGLETRQVTTPLAAVSTEEFVIKLFDNLHMSEATTIQVEFSDP